MLALHRTHRRSPDRPDSAGGRTIQASAGQPSRRDQGVPHLRADEVAPSPSGRFCNVLALTGVQRGAFSRSRSLRGRLARLCPAVLASPWGSLMQGTRRGQPRCTRAPRTFVRVLKANTNRIIVGARSQAGIQTTCGRPPGFAPFVGRRQGRGSPSANTANSPGPRIPPSDPRSRAGGPHPEWTGVCRRGTLV
jgi:hypothetical protein